MNEHTKVIDGPCMGREGEGPALRHLMTSSGILSIVCMVFMASCHALRIAVSIGSLGGTLGSQEHPYHHRSGLQVRGYLFGFLSGDRFLVDFVRVLCCGIHAVSLRVSRLVTSLPGVALRYGWLLVFVFVGWFDRVQSTNLISVRHPWGRERERGGAGRGALHPSQF